MYDEFDIIHEIYEWEKEYEKLAENDEQEEMQRVKARIKELKDILENENCN